MQWLILQGDARRIPLRDESVHCIVTSPPYWGLRDYKIKPQVWGGDIKCEHSFNLELVERENRTGLGLKDASTRGGGHKIAKVGWQRFERGFCVHCSAWLGVLGLEPTPEKRAAGPGGYAAMISKSLPTLLTATASGKVRISVKRCSWCKEEFSK